MLDIGSIDCIELFKTYAGSSPLKLYQYTTSSNEPSATNPYELPTETTRPHLLLETECVSVKHPKDIKSTRGQVGIVNDAIWMCSISGDTDSSKLILGSYVFISFKNTEIKGVLTNVERKYSNRFQLFIDTSQNVPFSGN